MQRLDSKQSLPCRPPAHVAWAGASFGPWGVTGLGQAGRTFSRTGHGHMPTLKPMTPLQSLMQASMKPPAPLLAPKQRPLKPATPLQPKNARKTASFRPQRRWQFRPHTDASKQRRHRFQESGPPSLQDPDVIPVAGGRARLQCPWVVAVPGLKKVACNSIG